MNAVKVVLRGIPRILTASIFLVAGFGCASFSRTLGDAVAPEGVDLSGSWVFNEEESDDTSMLQQMEQMPARAGEGGMSGGSPRVEVLNESSEDSRLFCAWSRLARSVSMFCRN